MHAGRDIERRKRGVRSAETFKLVEGNIAPTAIWRGEGELRGVEDPMHVCKPTTGTWEVFTLPRQSRRGHEGKENRSLR